MAAELVITGDGPKHGPAVDDREFTIARKGYDRSEVKAYLVEIEAHLRQFEEWAQRTNARLAYAEEKNRAIADVDEAMVAVFETKGRVLEQAKLEAARIEADAQDRARVEAGVVGAEIVAEAQEDARRIAETAQRDARRIVETALAATTPLTAESILSAAKAEADRLLRDTRAEADRLIDEARAQVTVLRTVEPLDPSTDIGPEAADQSIGSATVARLVVEMDDVRVDLEGSADEEAPAGDAAKARLFLFDDEEDDAPVRSRYQRASASLPMIGDDATDVFGVIERLRKRIQDA